MLVSAFVLSVKWWIRKLKCAAAVCLGPAAAMLQSFTSTSTRNAAAVQVKIEEEIRLTKSFRLLVFQAILIKNWRFRCFVVF